MTCKGTLLLNAQLDQLERTVCFTTAFVATLINAEIQFDAYGNEGVLTSVD